MIEFLHLQVECFDPLLSPTHVFDLNLMEPFAATSYRLDCPFLLTQEAGAPSRIYSVSGNRRKAEHKGKEESKFAGRIRMCTCTMWQ